MFQSIVCMNRKLLASVTTATSVSEELHAENIQLSVTNKWLNDVVKTIQNDKEQLLTEKVWNYCRSLNISIKL